MNPRKSGPDTLWSKDQGTSSLASVGLTVMIAVGLALGGSLGLARMIEVRLSGEGESLAWQAESDLALFGKLNRRVRTFEVVHPFPGKRVYTWQAPPDLDLFSQLKRRIWTFEVPQNLRPQKRIYTWLAPDFGPFGRLNPRIRTFEVPEWAKLRNQTKRFEEEPHDSDDSPASRTDDDDEGGEMHTASEGGRGSGDPPAPPAGGRGEDDGEDPKKEPFDVQLELWTRLALAYREAQEVADDLERLVSVVKPEERARLMAHHDSLRRTLGEVAGEPAESWLPSREELRNRLETVRHEIVQAFPALAEHETDSHAAYQAEVLRDYHRYAHDFEEEAFGSSLRQIEAVRTQLSQRMHRVSDRVDDAIQLLAAFAERLGRQVEAGSAGANETLSKIVAPALREAREERSRIQEAVARLSREFPEEGTPLDRLYRLSMDFLALDERISDTLAANGTEGVAAGFRQRSWMTGAWRQSIDKIFRSIREPPQELAVAAAGQMVIFPARFYERYMELVARTAARGLERWEDLLDKTRTASEMLNERPVDAWLAADVEDFIGRANAEQGLRAAWELTRASTSNPENLDIQAVMYLERRARQLQDEFARLSQRLQQPGDQD